MVYLFERKLARGLVHSLEFFTIYFIIFVLFTHFFMIKCEGFEEFYEKPLTKPSQLTIIVAKHLSVLLNETLYKEK